MPPLIAKIRHDWTWRAAPGPVEIRFKPKGLLMTDAPPRDGSPAAIVMAREVHKTYRSDGATVHALRGVSLSVQRGEMVSIMGPSGCGKTTLLNTLSGLDSIDSGLIMVDGQVIHEMSDRDRTDYRARHMGFVFQFFNLLPVLTAAENVELPLLLAGTPSRDARQRAIEALRAVGLEGLEKHRPSQLSGGERQRTTVARALVNNPAIVWADEPTGNLDSSTADAMMTLIENLNVRNGQTFVIVTHDSSIGERSHRVVHMRDGQIEDETKHRPIETAAPVRP